MRVTGIKEKANRFMELEGLRVIAAVMVVLYHFFECFYAIAIYGVGHDKAPAIQHMRFEDNLYGSPLGAIFSGTFAVSIFFVLSGFVLSIAFFKTRKTEVIKKTAIKRYPRLMLPALASVLLSVLLIKFGFSYASQASSISQAHWLLGMWNLDLSFLGAIKEGVWGVFIEAKNSNYNPVLWTMCIEFVGSLIVFGVALLFGDSKRRWFVYGILIAIFSLFYIWFAAFIIGMMFADLYARGSIVHSNRKKWVSISLILLGVFIGGYPYATAHETLYQFITIPGIDLPYRKIYTIVGSTLLLYAILTTPFVANFLKRKKVSMLGKYTFSLYLTHMAVFYTFTSALFVFLSHYMGYNWSAGIAFVASIPVIVGLTWLFERYVDAPSVRFASYLAWLCYSPQPLRVRERAIQFATNIKTKLLPEKMPDMEEE